jgi:tetratricopeptide (TPR) repeat protein
MRRLALLLLFAGPALAAPDAGEDAPAPGADLAGMVDVALRNLARARNAEALERLRDNDRPAALAKLREAYALDRTDAEIVNNLGYVLLLLGNRAEAVSTLREALSLDPQRVPAMLNLVDLLADEGSEPERLAEAAALLTRARELKGNQPRLIRRQALVAARRGRFDEAERFWREVLALTPAAERDAAQLEVGDFYRDFGREADAIAAYRGIAAGPSAAAAAERIRDLEVDQAARRLGWHRPGAEVSAQARRQAERARALAREGRVDLAMDLLRQAIDEAPRYAAARLWLGDLLRDAGRRDEAELTYLRALAIDPSSAEAPARLGELYLAWPPKPRADEAALFLGRALELRPDWTHLDLPLARAAQAAGDPVGAMHDVEQFLAHGPPGPRRDEALALQRDLAGLLAQVYPAGVPAAPSEPHDGQPPAFVEASNRARVLLAQGENDAAMRVLEKLPDAERGPIVRNLEAHILTASGRLDEAAAAYRASLAQDAAQPDVRAELGALDVRRGEVDEGRRQLEQAELEGSVAATVALAELDAGPAAGWWVDLGHYRALVAARDRAERAARADLPSPEDPSLRYRASALHADVGARLARVHQALAATGALLLALLAMAYAWRRGGSTLGQFIAKHPEAGPEVQSILSAIRHEVLKHNTLVLTGLADALTRGEPAGEKAAWCHDSLFGDGRGEAVVHRLRAYAERLKQLGRAHRMRLNLKRRDPALRALLAGFRTLERVAPLLRRADALGTRQRARLLRAVRRAARLLNVEGYEAVRTLLDRLRVLEVDEALLRGIYERTRREPERAGVAMAPLELEVAPGLRLPVGVAIPRHAFADILANLIRNAVQAAVKDRPGTPVALGLALGSEVDPITGLERVVLAVRDRAPQGLSAATLRGRDIADGLGLTTDLVSRYEGTIDVRGPDGPWAKAVVVKLPRLHPDEEDEAGTEVGA